MQAQALAQAGVQWARQIMFDDDARSARIDHLGEPWALTLPATPIENGSIEGRIVDAQGLLNVNALGYAGAQGSLERTRFERLFARLGLPRASLDVIADWVDADGDARASGAEDAWYRQQASPALAANAPIVRLAELSALRGFTADAATTLAPYLAALPAETKLNVNTAPAAVLAAAIPGLDGDALSAFVASRTRAAVRATSPTFAPACRRARRSTTRAPSPSRAIISSSPSSRGRDRRERRHARC